MKTSKLIQLLQEADPSGELHVCVDNTDISYVHKEEAYYDGVMEVVLRNKEGYAVGGKITGKGYKVRIRTIKLSDLIFEHPDFPIDLSELPDYRRVEYEESIKKIRENCARLHQETYLNYFIQWAKDRALKLYTEIDEIGSIATDFFFQHVSYKDELPEDLKGQIYTSYLDRKFEHWDRLFMVYWDGFDFNIRKRV